MSEIRDNQTRHRFELDVEGRTAFVTYQAIAGELMLLHTETPVELRGRGIGSRLARGVLDTIRARGQKIRVACDFLQGFVRKNPEFDDLTI